MYYFVTDILLVLFNLLVTNQYFFIKSSYISVRKQFFWLNSIEISPADIYVPQETDNFLVCDIVSLTHLNFLS